MTEQAFIAAAFAANKHKDQKYGEHPYVYHLLQVDKLVVEVYADKNRGINEPFSKELGDEMDCIRAIAFLHDVIEDTDTSLAELVDAGFCAEVVYAVNLLSKDEYTRYEDYIEGVIMYELARKVKLCDTAANLMNSIKEGNTKRINKYSKQIQLLGGF